MYINQLENMLKRDLNLFFRPQLGSDKVARYPLTNLGVDSDDNLHIEVAVAGFGKNDIELEQKGNYLIITGSKLNAVNESNDGEDNGIHYIQQHISSKDFERTIVLNENYVGGDIKADVANGILNIVVKPNEPTRKLIQIGN